MAVENKTDKLNRLPEITERVLHHLTADDQLKLRISSSALKDMPSRRMHSFRSVPALLALSALLVISFIGIGSLKTMQNPAEPQITSISAGSRMKTSPVFRQYFNGSAEKEWLTLEHHNYFLVREPDFTVQAEDILGKTGENGILSSALPDGTIIYRTERSDILAVRTESGTIQYYQSRNE